MWVFKVLSLTLKTRFVERQRLFSHFYILLVLMKNDKLLVPNMFSVLIFKRIFSNLPLDYFDIVFKYNVGLKTLLLQGLSELECYGDLVYKFRKIIGKNDFPYDFKKIIVRYKKIGYNTNVMRQTACLVVNPIKVYSFAYLFNCATVGRTSD